MFEALLLDFIARHYREAAHSIFAPSASAMWMTCPGSLIPNLLAPDSAGFEAAEGTVAHSLHEEWLKTGEAPRHRIGEVVVMKEGANEFEITIDSLMLDAVQESVDRLINLPGDIFVEEKVYFSELTPIDKQGGTADFYACEPGKLTIRDYKHGKGVLVTAEKNSQAMLYALGVFYKWDWLYDFQEIDIGIHQPRLDHFDYWTVSRKDLLKFAKRVKEAAHNAWRLNAPLQPSDKGCKFCKVKATCPAYVKVLADIDEGVFGPAEYEAEEIEKAVSDLRDSRIDPDFRHPTMLSTEDMAQLLPLRSMVENWFAAIDTELEVRALNGEQIPGRKLVESRTNRLFRDEKRAIERLSEAGVHWTELYKLSFISPAQAEDLLRTRGMKRKEAVEFLESVVVKPPGKPTLVPLSDSRPAYERPGDDVFAPDL